jgi:hypothetical protein
VVNWLTQVEARLTASEPIDSPTDRIEEPAVSAADAMEAASLVMELTAVETTFTMEVTSAAAEEAMFSAPETIEFTSMPSGLARAALARNRAEVRMVNFIVN